MKVYKTNIFSKKNIKNMGLSDSTLMKIALDVMSGVYEANLGGGVIKKRLALPGRGKRSGARTIIFFKAGQNLFFSFFWTKAGLCAKGTSEIRDDELESYKDLAKDLLSLTKADIEKLLKLTLLVEVKNDQ